MHYGMIKKERKLYERSDSYMADMSLVGRRNKANGAMFENWISLSCKHYLEENIAFIEKTPEPFRITAKGKDGIISGYYAKAAQPDYKGILYGGHGIMFEAKHTDTMKINQNAVTDTQSENLDIYYRFGAICFVLVSMGFETFYRVPWSVWKNMKSLFGHKHMTLEELSPYQIHANLSLIDFLDNIKCLKE